MGDKSKMTSHNYRLGFYLAATFIPVFLFVLSISLLIKNLNGQIDFIRAEIKGVREVESIHESIVLLQKIRGIASIGAQSDEFAQTGNLAALKEDFIGGLDRIAASRSAFTDGSAEILPLKEEAEILFLAPHGPRTFEQYTYLIRKMRGLMQVVANRSNLILDPVMDTYHLANLTVNRFPDLIEYIGRVRGAGGTSIASHDLSHVTELRMHLATLDNEEKEVNLAVRTILQSSPQLKSPLDPVLKEARDMLVVFIEASKMISGNGGKEVLPAQYFDQGTHAIDIYLKVYHKSSELLIARLGERLSNLDRIRLVSISGVLFSFLLMVYFIRSFYTQNRQAFRQVEELSITDALTGLYNRRQFYEIIARELPRFQRDRKSFALAILDIDHFKHYNDTYGHLAGDEVLRRVAQAMSGNLQRAGDFLFRLGGEEFCFFFGGEAREQATAGAESVRASIEALRIPHDKNSAGSFVTVSIGMAYLPEVGHHDYSKIMKKADEALYAAKGEGRNRCCVVEIAPF